MTSNANLAAPNDLDAYFMPFTSNRAFKARPKLIAAAEGMYYASTDGRKILDGIAGLWCCNAGHGRKPIVQAIQAQAAELDFSPPFQFAHPKAFQLATRVADLAPAGLDHVFFTNSGSEAVDTALKLALATHIARGQGTRQRLIGRERGYHGVNFGGTAVGGIVANRKLFGTLVAGVDHLPHTYNRAEQAFTKGEPDWGAHLADDLERLVALHDASTIAAVIVEPMAGSTGVLPAPKGYLQKLRAICDKHGILLIFDEVISGFGRLGHAFAAERYGVTPDMITFAKGVTSGTVPMGGVVVSRAIHDSLMRGPEHAIEVPHGYTYSAHPLACAAGLATLDLYREEGLFERARAIEPVFAEAVHGLRGKPHVVDIRTVGLTAAIDLAPREGLPGRRAFDVVEDSFWTHNLVVRQAGDSIVLTPALVVEESEIGLLVERLGAALAAPAT